MQTKNSQDLSQMIDRFRNYSKKDGHLCRNIDNKKFVLKRKDRYYCPNCKTKNELSSIYCKNCGFNLETVEEKKTRLNLEALKSNIDFKHSFKIAALSSIVLFLISFILKLFVNLTSQNTLLSQITTSDLLLMMNGGLLKGSTYMQMGYGYNQGYGFYLQFNLLILILIPILVNMLVYRLLSRKRESNLMPDSIGLGISYGVILALASVLLRNTVNLGDGFFSSYTISYGISALSVLVRGFLIGFIAVLLSNIRVKNSDNIFVNILKLTVKTIVVGYLVMIIILALGSLVNINYVGELSVGSLNLNIPILFTQMAFYLWSFANCLPLSIAGKNIFIGNLFSSGFSIELKLVLVSIVAISFLVILVAGTRLNALYKDEDQKKVVIIFSSVYSILMGILALFTSINIDLSSLSLAYVQISVNVILSVIISFLYSFVAAYIGCKLNIWDE